MEAILIKSRYKVTHVLHAEEDYAALMTVDVESRDKEEYLLNVYAGALIKQYVDVFDRLRHCPVYGGMFIDQGDSLVAAFRAQGGQPIDEVFFRGAKLDWQLRMDFAEALFHLALMISDYPPEVSCAAFLSHNLRMLVNERRVAVNYEVRPLPDMNARELVYLAIDQIKKVLLLRYDSPAEEVKFLETLDNNVFLTPVALYSHWQRNKKAIQADYEKLYGKSGLQRMLYLLVQNIWRFFRRARKKRR